MMRRIHKCDCTIHGGFCGICQECGANGHVAYFPYKGEWCHKCYPIVKKQNLKRIARKYKNRNFNHN